MILNELEDLLRKLGIEFRYEKGFFKGGLCTVEGKQYFYLSRFLPFEQNLNIIVKYLKELELENVYIKPKLRELLEAQSE